MPAYFFDSSAVVKFYVAETGSGWVANLLLDEDDAGVPLNQSFFAEITVVEVTAALVRRAKSDSALAARLSACLANFYVDSGALWHQVVLTQSHLSSAVVLAQRHGLRGYDAVQLSVAHALNQERLVLTFRHSFLWPLTTNYSMPHRLKACR